MNPHRVIFTDAAARDLDDIFDYIADSDSIERANYVVARIEQVALKLDILPNRGAHPKELLEVGNRTYREVHFKPLRIVYRISESHVHVFLIADGRRDMRSLLARRLLGA